MISQNLLRAANDGYDVSPLIEGGADPMSSGVFPVCLLRTFSAERRAAKESAGEN